jgi:hypothetical protein
MAEHSFLLKNLVLFGRLLRSVGLDVGPGQVVDLAAAFEHIDIGKRDDVYHAARALFVHCRADLALFDLAFRLFWQVRSGARIEMPPLAQAAPPPDAANAPPRTIPLDPEGVQRAHESDRVVVEWRQTYDSTELLRKKNFEAFTWEEIQQAKEMMAQMTWHITERRVRRQMRVTRGHYLDMRALMRRNLRYGGEFLDLAWRDLKFKPRPLVVLCDISGSMEQYSRMLLHFIYTLANGMDHVEAFLFGTRLTRVTRQIRRKDIDEAFREVGAAVQDWGGGTRIGDALKTFNYHWGRRVLGGGAVVLLISDGWDRGNVDLLEQEMARLQRSCFRLIWLNPLLASPDYEPLTRGLQAALAYVDDFMPMHNLESLEALGRTLSQLRETRPARRQQSPQ